jgi:hypothetical protein
MVKNVERLILCNNKIQTIRSGLNDNNIYDIPTRPLNPRRIAFWVAPSGSPVKEACGG